MSKAASAQSMHDPIHTNKNLNYWHNLKANTKARSGRTTTVLVASVDHACTLRFRSRIMKHFTADRKVGCEETELSSNPIGAPDPSDTRSWLSPVWQTGTSMGRLLNNECEKSLDKFRHLPRSLYVRATLAQWQSHARYAQLVAKTKTSRLCPTIARHSTRSPTGPTV